ncbi:hypothetical protein H4R19_007163, partial [Coemansia spiralis]
MAPSTPMPKGRIAAKARPAATKPDAQSDDEHMSGSSSDNGGNQSAATSEAESDYEELARTRKRELKAKRSKKTK